MLGACTGATAPAGNSLALLTKNGHRRIQLYQIGQRVWSAPTREVWQSQDMHLVSRVAMNDDT